MNKQDMMKIQQSVLRVSIHCDGCSHKVKKKLKKIEGVYKVSVDVEQGKVTVSGNVDPAILIEKLEKSGKHAELWGPQKGPVSIMNMNMNNQFKNIQQIKNNHGSGKDIKDQKKVGFQAPHQIQGKGGAKDVKFMGKDQKTVKFHLPEDEEDDDEFDDEYDDFDDDSDFEDDDFGDYHKPPSKVAPVGGGGGGHGHGPQSNKATAPNDHHKSNKDGNKGGKKGKKGGRIDMFLKGMFGKKAGSKNGNKDGCEKENGKKSGKNGMFAGGEGKTGAINGKDSNHNIRGGGKTSDSLGKNFDGGQKGFHEINANHKGGGGGGRNMSGQMGDQMGNFQPVQGLPAGGRAMNGGHFQGDLYNQQQMAHMMMMMNQQRTQNGHDPMTYMRPQPAMNYGPPHPAMNYGPPHPAMHYGPPPVNDQYTHIFSDENTDGCSIM